MSHRHWIVSALAAIAAPAFSFGQSTGFQSSGVDFSPQNSGGKVITNAHDDASNVDYTNVRVSAYAFATDPEDPNFTQDPGFNTPAGGLPPGATLSIGVLGPLQYFAGGNGPVTLGAPVGGEVLEYNFATPSRFVTGTSGPQTPIPLGATTSGGAIHKHLNAYLESASQTRDTTTHTSGVYVAQLQANVTGLISSDPIFAVYSYNATQSATDRTKFYLRNHFAPGSTLLNNATSMIGLSQQPGEANLATGGVATLGEVDELTADANRGSVAIAGAPSGPPLIALLYLTGAASDVSSAISNLDIPDGYDIAASTVGASDPLYADVQRAKQSYAGFSALVKFSPTPDVGAFTWDFAANQNVLVDKITIVPEPATLAAAFAGAAVVLRRRRRAVTA